MKRPSNPPTVSQAAAAALLLLACAAGRSPAATPAEDHGTGHAAKGAAPAPAAASSKAEIVPVQHGVYLIYAGEGSNVVVQIGEQGVVVVDTATAAVSDKILAALRTLTDKPVRYVLDTSADADHVGGNEMISRAGVTFGGGYTSDEHFSFIFAHENVLNAMSAPTGQKAAAPSTAWPTDTYFQDSIELYFNDEPIQMLYQPNAHTDGDSIVFFRRSDVIATGDVFSTEGYPVIDLEHGGSINGIIAALNRIIDITIPKRNQEDGTLVVPGHGRVCDEYDVVVYRDMVTIIRDRIADMIKKGMSLDAVNAAKPSYDYDGRYGATSGAWTTDKFIEAVYKSLQSPPQEPK
ncbi:MAG: MBL fold metallo-hydrolase [Steroidobacteraceae bacterium]|jgi:glyoxylase-like metal-dependent hydrolase (beta-lactamase superfamily II)